MHLIAFSDFPKILINYPLNLKGHDYGSRLNKKAKCCKSHSSQNHWPFFSQQNALIFKILFCHDWSCDNDCEFYIINGIGTGIGGHWLFDDFLRDPAKSSCQTKLSSELAMNMKLSMNRISCLISISSFVFLLMYLPTKTSLLKMMYFFHYWEYIWYFLHCYTEIFDEQMWVIIGQIMEYNWGEIWLFEFDVTFSMGSAVILSREMTVVSDFVIINFLIIIN